MIIREDAILTTKQHRDVLKFINYVAKLNLIEVMGCAQLLGVNTIEARDIVSKEEDKDLKTILMNTNTRDIEAIISDMIDSFLGSSGNKKKEILRILKLTVR